MRPIAVANGSLAYSLTVQPMSTRSRSKTTPNYQLIRERCSYPSPALEKPNVPWSNFEWRFDDQFGTRYGRFLYRPREESGASAEQWEDVFQRRVHFAGFLVARDFSVFVIFEDGCFAVGLAEPPRKPKIIFRSEGRLELRGISPDECFLLLDAAQEENWFRPEALVLDLAGKIRARLGQHRGVAGCWAGAWAPRPGDQRVIMHHEASGFAEPAIWHPFEDRVEEIRTELEGEFRAVWDRTGKAILLHRTLNGCSDLHRMDLSTKSVEQLQPLDGVIYRHETNMDNRVVGLWSSNDMYAQQFCEKERFACKGFQPTAPLTPLRFRMVAAVPCIVGEPVKTASPQWTIFHGYGDYSYHQTVCYWSKLQIFLDHGFRVVLVNTRGCNGFGRAWREGTAGNVGFTELEDLQSVRSALVEEELVDPARTIISGESWGGYMTLLAIGTQPELWRMGVASVPVGDWRTLHKETDPILWAVRRYQFGGDPEAIPEVFKRISPISYAYQISRPILMIAGKHDLLCPPAQNIRFAEAVQNAGGYCKLHLYDGGHAPPSREAYIHHQNMIMEFLLDQCARMDNP